jgi:chemotaxis protein MotA
VGSANLFSLPCAGKLRIRIREKQVLQEMTLEAVLAIVEGVNPRALELRLNSFATTPPKRGLQKVSVT